MVRDWEIIREILVRLESIETPNAFVNANNFPERKLLTICAYSEMLGILRQESMSRHQGTC
jgi:hypothetical protein